MAEKHVALTPFPRSIRPTVSDGVESASCGSHIYAGSRLQDCNKTAHLKHLDRYTRKRGCAQSALQSALDKRVRADCTGSGRSALRVCPNRVGERRVDVPRPAQPSMQWETRSLGWPATIRQWCVPA